MGRRKRLSISQVEPTPMELIDPNDRKKRWTDDDVVVCTRCYYYQVINASTMLMACHYPIIANKLRPCRPCDCYLQEGTPFIDKKSPDCPKPKKKHIVVW